MAIDYYSLLSKAVAGKDASARHHIYRESYALIERSGLPDAEAARYAAALQVAAHRIESEIEQENAESSAALKKTLSAPANWKPLAFGGAAVAVAIAVSAALYGYFAIQRPHAGAVVASRPAQKVEDKVVADLAPGVDGGSSAASLPYAMQRQVVFYRSTNAPGSIVIDRESRFLYLIDSGNSARRYGIGVAQECLKGGNLFRVTNKVEWPGGPDGARPAPAVATDRTGNALGSRALLLDKPGLIIHGTNSPATIGHLVASGCVRLVNDDVEDLYRRVPLETRVVFVS